MTTEKRGLDSEAPVSQEDPGTSELRSLLRGALHEDVSASRDLLPEVQRKIRVRSRGKFYADGWSTVEQTPISTYLATSVVMLVVIGAAYAVLSQLSGEALPAVNVPAPVQLLPPAKRAPPGPSGR